MATKPSQRKTFRPFPKDVDGNIDKEAVRASYLKGLDFPWAMFCRRHKYSPELRHEFPIKRWQADWVQRRIAEQSELLIADAVELRSEVLGGRTQAIRLQHQSNLTLRRLFNRTLAHAEQSTEVLSAKELLTLAGSQRLLIKCEFETLLLNRESKEEPIQHDSPHNQQDLDLEGERLRGMGVSIIGQPMITQETLTSMMKHYIDQEKLEARSEHQEPDLNDPLTPLDPEDALNEV